MSALRRTTDRTDIGTLVMVTVAVSKTIAFVWSLTLTRVPVQQLTLTHLSMEFELVIDCHSDLPTSTTSPTRYSELLLGARRERRREDLVLMLVYVDCVTVADPVNGIERSFRPTRSHCSHVLALTEAENKGGDGVVARRAILILKNPSAGAPAMLFRTKCAFTTLTKTSKTFLHLWSMSMLTSITSSCHAGRVCATATIYPKQTKETSSPHRPGTASLVPLL